MRRASSAHPRTLLFLLLTPVILLGAGPAPSPVADAAMRGDAEAVRTLIRDGADVNAAQGDGMTALHWAARNGDAGLATLLIRAGANVRAGTRIGRYTPLHLASQAAHAEVVDALLRGNADPHAATTNSGATPLHLAASSGDPEVLRLLLARGVDPDVREASWGQTPLVFAAAKNRTAAIRVLLEAGADPSLASHALDTTEREKGDEAAEERLTALLEEFKKQEGGGPGWQPTPSQVQAAIQAAREVQRKWPDLEGEDGDEEEQDPSARPPSYAQLVGGWGGLTPLHHAVRQGHREAVLTLLEGGADIDQPSEGDHTTPLLMAALNGQFDLALLLLEKGADPNGASNAGATPLYAVLERQWAPRASYSHPTEHHQQSTTYLDMMRLLLEAGADPNVRLASHLWYMEYTFGVLRGSGIDLKGATPFWRAAYALDVDAMRLLRDFGADPAIPTMKPPERRRPIPQEEEEEEEEEPKPAVVEGEGEGAAEPPEGEAKEAEPAEVEQAEAEEAAAEAAEEAAEETVPAETQEAEEAVAAEEKAAEEQDEEDEEKEDEDPSGLPPVPVGGPAIFPIHAAAGVGYGQSFAGNAHRYVPQGWMAALRFLVEETGADVNARDANGYTPLHHAASRGDEEMILYLVELGADVTLLSRSGQTTADMANGPVQRVQPFPGAVALLEKLGSKNNHKCVSC